MIFFLLYLFFYYGFIYVMMSVEFFLIGKKRSRILLPVLLLLIIIPFHSHIMHWSDVAIYSATASPVAGASQFVEETVRRFAWTGYSIISAFYLVALALTWRVPFLAPLLPLTLLFLYNGVAYQPFSDAVQSPATKIWLDDYVQNSVFSFDVFLMSLCLLAYTLPSLRKHMKDTMPEALRREVEPRA